MVLECYVESGGGGGPLAKEIILDKAPISFHQSSGYLMHSKKEVSSKIKIRYASMVMHQCFFFHLF